MCWSLALTGAALATSAASAAIVDRLLPSPLVFMPLLACMPAITLILLLLLSGRGRVPGPEACASVPPPVTLKAILFLEPVARRKIQIARRKVAVI